MNLKKDNPVSFYIRWMCFIYKSRNPAYAKALCRVTSKGRSNPTYSKALIQQNWPSPCPKTGEAKKAVFASLH